jgi:hypothetical protein
MLQSPPITHVTISDTVSACTGSGRRQWRRQRSPRAAYRHRRGRRRLDGRIQEGPDLSRWIVRRRGDRSRHGEAKYSHQWATAQFAAGRLGRRGHGRAGRHRSVVVTTAVMQVLCFEPPLHGTRAAVLRIPLPYRSRVRRGDRIQDSRIQRYHVPAQGVVGAKKLPLGSDAGVLKAPIEEFFESRLPVAQQICGTDNRYSEQHMRDTNDSGQ